MICHDAQTTIQQGTESRDHPLGLRAGVYAFAVTTTTGLLFGVLITVFGIAGLANLGESQGWMPVIGGVYGFYAGIVIGFLTAGCPILAAFFAARVGTTGLCSLGSWGQMGRSLVLSIINGPEIACSLPPQYFCLT